MRLSLFIYLLVFNQRSNPARSWLFKPESDILLVDSICAEAIRHVRSLVFLLASFPEFVWIVGGIAL
jgi:hypothetical protein